MAKDPSSSNNRFKNVINDASRYTQNVIDDFARGDLPDELRRDFRETYDFYVTDEERRHLAQMGSFKRSILSAWYIARGLFMKLGYSRRLLVLLALVLAWGGVTDGGEDTFVGFILLFFVLGLELKDKTEARVELQEGRAVQLAIMPASIPHLDGWEIWIHSTPANDVGGDLVDHLMTDTDRLALTLGDVAGKGLPAALMAAKLQATLRAIAPDESDLSARAAKLNRIIRRDGLPNRFISVLHAEVSPQSDTVRYVNAGHHPPIHLREDGCRELERGDPAIGLSVDAKYGSQEVTLAQGDLLIIYSDGVTEARNEIGRFYSDERFLELVQYCHGMSAHALGERILESVTDFVQQARQSDDLSLIILRRKSDALPAVVDDAAFEDLLS
ncbi:MAG: PP2C family protein-serine/threonine phosphatase [Bacteroidota bacterium]|nr:PP2C family protein-serine/threonine phosphatase [Bacteroidota bacterium]